MTKSNNWIINAFNISGEKVALRNSIFVHKEHYSGRAITKSTMSWQTINYDKHNQEGHMSDLFLEILPLFVKAEKSK